MCSGKLAFAVFVLLICSAETLRVVSAKGQVSVGPTGVARDVQVVVRNPTTQEGVAGVKIKITGPSDEGSERQTDPTGVVTFRNLPTGTYSLVASGAGYFAASRAGKPLPNAAYVAEVVVDASQIRFRRDLWMVKGVQLRGSVRSVDGRDQSGAKITVLAEGFPARKDAKELLQVGERVTTDVRGKFASVVMPPGTYYIRAEPSGAPGSGSSSDAVAIATYFPSATGRGDAVSISLKDGDVKPDVDIVMREERAYSVSGQIVGFGDGPAGATARLETFVVGSYGRQSEDVSYSTVVPSAISLDGDTLSYRLGPLPAGRHDLYPVVTYRPGRTVATRKISIELVGRDLAAPVASISQGQSVSVRFKAENGAALPAAPMAGVRVSLVPIDPIPQVVTPVSGLVGELENASGVVLQNVQPGRYWLELSRSLPLPYYIADIWTDDDARAVAGGIVEVEGSRPMAVDLIVGAQAGAVRGSLVGARVDTPTALLLVPVGSRKYSPLFIKRLLIVGSSSFELRGVSPGDYTLYAFDSLSLQAQVNAGFLAQHAGHACRVRVLRGSSSICSLQVETTD